MFIIGLSLIQVFLLVVFFSGDGFVGEVFPDITQESVSYSREFMSSGGNDDGVLVLFILVRVFLIILSVFLFAYKGLLFFYLGNWVFEFLGMLFVSGSSDIGRTIAHDYIFLLWFVFWIVSPLVLCITFIRWLVEGDNYPKSFEEDKF